MWGQILHLLTYNSILQENKTTIQHSTLKSNLSSEIGGPIYVTNAMNTTGPYMLQME